MRKGISGFIFVVFFGTILYYGTSYQEYLHNSSATTHTIHPYLIFTVLFPIFLGVLLTSPQIHKIATSEGKLIIDRTKLTFMGIPIFLVSIIPFVYLSSISKYLPFLYSIQKYPIISFAAGVALAYIIVTSVTKE